MILRFLGLQALLDRLFDEGWCLQLAPEATAHAPSAPETGPTP